MTQVLDRPIEVGAEIHKLDDVSQRLLEAADLLDAEGFIQGSWILTREKRDSYVDLALLSPDTPCGRCTVGAVLQLGAGDANSNGNVFMKLRKDPVGQAALLRLANHLGIEYDDEDVAWKVSNWSEATGRTREEVTKVLREAAFA